MATKKEMQELHAQIAKLTKENEAKDALLMSNAVGPEVEKKKSVDARSIPAVLRDMQDAREIPIHEEKERVMRSTGNASESLDARGFDIIDKAPSQEKLKELAFMEEYMTIRVHDTTDENQVPVPPVWNGGTVQYFMRGEEATVKRKYVERLARAKITTYTQRKQRDSNDNEIYVQVPHTALIYPFEVVEDANPRGRDWLRAIVSDHQ